MIYPKSKVTVSALTVTTEITEEDEGDPRIMEVSLHDDEAPGLITITDKNKDNSSIAFFVEQWQSIRGAVDQLAGCARTHDEVIGIAPDRKPDAWQGVHDKTDLYYQKPVQGDVRPLYATLSAETREEVIREVVKDDGGLEMALAQAAAIIERLNRERSQIKHGLQGLVDYLGDAERANSHPAPRAAAVIALRHAFNSAATILKAMHEAECRMDPRK